MDSGKAASVNTDEISATFTDRAAMTARMGYHYSACTDDEYAQIVDYCDRHPQFYPGGILVDTKLRDKGITNAVLLGIAWVPRYRGQDVYVPGGMNVPPDFKQDEDQPPPGFGLSTPTFTDDMFNRTLKSAYLPSISAYLNLPESPIMRVMREHDEAEAAPWWKFAMVRRNLRLRRRAIRRTIMQGIHNRLFHKGFYCESND